LIVLLFAGILIFAAAPKRKRASVQQASLPPEKEKRDFYVFENLPTGKGILFSETFAGNFRETTDTLPFGDLWFQGVDRQKRLIADAVVRAGFSPDGKKLAYIRTNSELHVETIEGRTLARLQRIHDHNWSSDSATMILSVMVSLEYPELQQTLIYNLNSGKLLQLSGEK
jgi:hypothetical protein